jgi:ferredoxin
MKIIQEKDKCIGCGSCVALCPDCWEMGEDGLASLKGGSKNDQGQYELETETVGCCKEAADACPVQCIIIQE